jgi:hypothetical protein
MSDMVELVVLVIETEQERADDRRVRRIAEAADDAVRRAGALDLDHGPLAFEVGAVVGLGHHAFQLALIKPPPGEGPVGRPRGEAEFGRLVNLKEGLKPFMSLRPRPALEVRPIDIDQHVEQGVDRRRFLGEAADAALGGVEASLQHLEGEGVAVSSQQFAVETEARFGQGG